MAEKIAILMSTYNGEKYIKCQIDSILNQTVKVPFHLFIRDDGSSDRTISIVKSYADNRLTIFEGKNIGSNNSFLELLKYAKTLPDEYIYFSFSDQDDQWDADKLAVALEHISRYPSSSPILYGSASCHVDANLNPLEERKKRIVKPLTLYNTIIQNIVPGHTYVFNRTFLNLIPDEVMTERIYFHDSFLINIANMAGVLIYDPYPHTNYRQHNRNVMGNTKNPIKWISQRSKRIINGDSKKYAKQIEYLYELYNQFLDSKSENEIRCFLNSRKNTVLRIKYILKSKLYRQNKTQTVLFRALYIIGGYNT